MPRVNPGSTDGKLAGPSFQPLSGWEFTSMLVVKDVASASLESERTPYPS